MVFGDTPGLRLPGTFDVEKLSGLLSTSTLRKGDVVVCGEARPSELLSLNFHCNLVGAQLLVASADSNLLHMAIQARGVAALSQPYFPSELTELIQVLAGEGEWSDDASKGAA